MGLNPSCDPDRTGDTLATVPKFSCTSLGPKWMHGAKVRSSRQGSCSDLVGVLIGVPMASLVHVQTFLPVLVLLSLVLVLSLVLLIGCSMDDRSSCSGLSMHPI